MSTNTVTLTPESLPELALSLGAEFPKAQANDVTIHALDARRVCIHMPVRRLAEYGFTCEPGRCSWTLPNTTIVVELGRFAVTQQAKNDVFCVHVEMPESAPIQELLTGLFRENQSPVREIFLKRSLRAIRGLKGLDEENLSAAVQAPTDLSVLLAVLNTDEALAILRGYDPLAGARLRGIAAKRTLLEGEGGVVSSAEAAELLQVTRQAIDKRRKEGKLLALSLGKKGYQYPVWQFGLEGLEEVLAALAGRDPWEQLSFFVNPNDSLVDRTPLELLREGKPHVPEVVKAAQSYVEHGA